MGAPTLLVGIGGTGSGIVQRVYELATDEQREHMAFVIFDTDVNELRVIEENTPQIKTVQTSSRMTVGEYLEVDEYARNTWFPVNRILNSKALTEGAGQVRAISRLAMNTTIMQGRMNPLDEAIEGLYHLSGERTVQAPRIIITGSLCGGTGSGLVLPISLYVRNYMTTKLQQGSAIIRGFFLLPEVFDGVIKTQSERNNLRSNAYAALRELDAFNMKADGKLPPEYDLHYYAPRAGSKTPEEYSGRPLDFCFLFDAQNINGQKLKSFAEYKEHAAHCIYGMAVAPTSKRSNSSEDNVIREVIYAGGRNRYAGAGSAILRYPTQDIKRYLGLCWARQSISEEWLRVDRDYKKKVKDDAKRRRSGASVEKIERGEQYVQKVDEGIIERKSYAMAIRDETVQHDENGFAETGLNWDKYIEEIGAYITKRIDSEKENLREIIGNVNMACAEATDKPEDPQESFNNWYKSLQVYQAATFKRVENMVYNIIYSLFRDADDYTKTTDLFRIEYWLHRDRQEESFIHPNAVRYFLYNLIAQLKSEERERRGTVDKINKYLRDFEQNTFSYDSGDGKDGVQLTSEAGFYDAHHMNEDSPLVKFLKRKEITAGTEALTDAMNTLKANIDKYWQIYAEAEVFSAAMSYASSLATAFEGFYDVLERTLSGLDIKINKMKEKYEYRKGEALRYVCADQTCLEGLEAEAVNRSSGFDTPPELNRKIFRSMKNYALAEQKPKAESYFISTFNDSIIGYFENEVMSQYGSIVDMDIITAMEKEAAFLHPDECLNTDAQQIYASKVIAEMCMLARPFIESPIGKEPRIIPSCAYSPDLSDPEKADFPGRKSFVSKYLKDGGGEADESIARNMILFYQAVYDLRANELSKFAPARDEETYHSPDGDYYKSYFELINQINPDAAKSKVITPHIDRWWHIIDKLPDLDERSQESQKNRINEAFFWGVVSKFIRYQKSNGSQFVYCLNQGSFRKSDNDEITQKLAYETVQFEESLIVSNGTPCDHLYEVLDAFTIYPALVTAVLGQAKKETDRHLYDKKRLKASFLISKINEFLIEEYQLGLENQAYKNRLIMALEAQLAEIDLIEKTKQESGDYTGEDREKDGDLRVKNYIEGLVSVVKNKEFDDTRSIFELPLVMKASVPAEHYHEKDLKVMLSSVFNVLRSYIHRFTTESEFAWEYSSILMEQYVKLLRNIIREGENFPLRDLFSDTSFTFICGMLQRELEDYDFYEEAAHVEKLTYKLLKK